MANKTVDIICSIEDDFPIILEAIDSEDVQFSLNRKHHYAKCYEDVHLFSGVSVLTRDDIDEQPNVTFQKCDSIENRIDNHFNIIKRCIIALNITFILAIIILITQYILG